ncbi:MAG: hypothetical protein ACD_8C00044G0005 [uncultured bacterium]|nr:MAG: hypothetical protein ACD_8C00044G0005 [uncultured bacterium]
MEEEKVNMEEQLQLIVDSSVSNSEDQEIAREIKIKEIIFISWNTFKNNIKFLLLIPLISISIRVVESLLRNFSSDNFVLTMILATIFFVLNVLISIGMMQLYLKISRGKEVELTELLDGYEYFWRFIGGVILYVLIVLSGYILLIVPGIIWQYKFSLFGYLIIDKNMSIVQALKESGKITNGFKWRLFLLQLATIPIIILGVMCFGVGIIVSVSIISLMSAYFYRVLIGEKIYS